MQNGMRTMRQNALLKVARGETDIAEVLSSTSNDEHKKQDESNVA